MRAQIAVVAVCLVASCAARNSSQVSMDSAPVVRICQIRENPHAYIGRLVRIKATYETDHLTYGFLKDETCEAGGTMEVSSAPSGDKSVKDFFSAADSKCVGARVHMCP